MSEGDESYVGRQFGSYRLTRLIGRGGFADVYQGEHIYLHTVAAVKVLRINLAHDSLEDFLKEARAIASLNHPHIIRLLECSVEPATQTPYLVMTYAPNGSMRQRFPRNTRLTPEQLLPAVQHVAAALHYAHQQKLIHRDIKPENMLLDQHGEVLLSDFGLVVMAQSSGSQTTKEMAGTVSYMSPEQLHGRPRPASDQYALGIVTYEWICGERPFQGSFVEIASQHVLSAPPSLLVRVPDLPPAVEQVVFKALAKNPEERFANVALFAQALTMAYQNYDIATIFSLTTQPDMGQPLHSTIRNAPPAPSDAITTISRTIMPMPSVSPKPTIVTGGMSPAGLVRHDSLTVADNAPTVYTPQVQPSPLASTARNITPHSGSRMAMQADSMPTARPIKHGSPQHGKREKKFSVLMALCAVLLVMIVLSSFAFSSAFSSGFIKVMAQTLSGITSTHTKPTTTAIAHKAQPTQTATQATSNGGINTANTTPQTRQLSATEKVTKTFKSTGSITITPGIVAKGMLTFTNTTSNAYQIPAGTLCSDVQGITVVTDNAATFKGNNPGETVTVPAHATMAGPQGNVPADDISTIQFINSLNIPNSKNSTNSLNSKTMNAIQQNVLASYIIFVAGLTPTPIASPPVIATPGSTPTPPPSNVLIKVTNANAFTGGQAVQSTPVVTQNDLNQAITTVQTKATNAAIQDIQNKEQANEHIVGQPQCSSTASSDHKAGDQVANFHVTVETTCSATVST